MRAAIVTLALVAIVALAARAYLEHERRCPGGYHELVDGELRCTGERGAPAAVRSWLREGGAQ